MATWIRQHRGSTIFRMPWHLGGPVPTRAGLLGLRLTICDSSLGAEDRGVDELEDPPLDERCPVCDGWLATQ